MAVIYDDLNGCLGKIPFDSSIPVSSGSSSLRTRNEKIQLEFEYRTVLDHPPHMIDAEVIWNIAIIRNIEYHDVSFFPDLDAADPVRHANSRGGIECRCRERLFGCHSHLGAGDCHHERH